MKNHKGAVATLLTLGLVVVGTLITLGTSLFVNNQKTNLASNSMAYTNPCKGPFTCGDNKIYYKSPQGVLIKTINSNKTCGTPFVSFAAWTAYCTGGSIPPSNTPVPAQGGGGVDCVRVLQEVKAECGNSSGDYTKVGCLIVDGEQTYRCKSDIVPTQPAGGNSDDVVTDENGIPGKGLDCCFFKNGVVRVFATYENRVFNDMTSDCSANNVVSSYQADPGGLTGNGPAAFYCPSGTQDYQPIDEYNRINNPGPGKGKKGGPCYTPYSNFAEEMVGGYTCDKPYVCSSNDSEGKCVQKSSLRVCSSGKFDFCIFGNNDNQTGPAVCSGLTEMGIKGCKPVPSGICSSFGTIHRCVAANISGKKCAWDGDGKKCIDKSAPPQVPLIGDCENNYGCNDTFAGTCDDNGKPLSCGSCNESSSDNLTYRCVGPFCNPTAPNAPNSSNKRENCTPASGPLAMVTPNPTAIIITLGASGGNNTSNSNDLSVGTFTVSSDFTSIVSPISIDGTDTGCNLIYINGVISVECDQVD